MHTVNAILGRVGIQISRKRRLPREFVEQYRAALDKFRKDNRDFEIMEEVYCDVGRHPQNYVDYECEFAAGHLARLMPACVLDVGSYRTFIIGLLASLSVTTVDVRPRTSLTAHENLLICDAKELSLPDACFDAVTSLCAIEHFGLGRYGDEYDPAADLKAFAHMARVLKPGGHLIFSTTLTIGHPMIVFNGHRIYDLGTVHQMCAGLLLEEERFYSHERGALCSLAEVTSTRGAWDVYLGCWRKPEGHGEKQTLHEGVQP
jgi:SAM-dependent methyltransferase